VLVAGVGGVPAAGDVRAVALNLTATGATAQTYLAVHPSGSGLPALSNLNPLPGQTVANAVVSAVGPDGHVSVFNAAGATHVVLDIVGWYSATGRPGGTKFVPVTPTRLADTRPDRPVFGTEPLLFSLAKKPPYDKVRAAALNVTVTEPQGEGYVAVAPWDGPPPGGSMLNFLPGQTVASAAVTAIGATGRVGVFNGSPHPHHQVVDLNGLFVDATAAAGGGFTPAAARLLDTRTAGGPLGPGEARTVAVAGAGIPGDAAAVVLNVTVTGPTAPTYVSLWPAGTARPSVSSVNAGAGQTVPNLVTTALRGGALQVFNAAGSTDVVLDVVGWYARVTPRAVT
jgi:hypothetical protein